jgi:hypothetical protein
MGKLKERKKWVECRNEKMIFPIGNPETPLEDVMCDFHRKIPKVDSHCNYNLIGNPTCVDARKE